MSVDALHWKYLDVLPFAVLAVLAGIFAAAFSWAAVKVHRFRLKVYTDRRFSGGTVGRCLMAPLRACCALRDRIDIITRRPTLPSKGVYLPLSVIRSAAKRDAAAEFDLHTPRGGVQPSTFRSRVLRGGQILCCGVGRAASQTASSSSSHQPLRSPRSVLRAKKMSDRRMKLAYVYIFLLSLSASLSRPLSASLSLPMYPRARGYDESILDLYSTYYGCIYDIRYVGEAFILSFVVLSFCSALPWAVGILSSISAQPSSLTVLSPLQMLEPVLTADDDLEQDPFSLLLKLVTSEENRGGDNSTFDSSSEPSWRRVAPELDTMSLETEATTATTTTSSSSTSTSTSRTSSAMVEEEKGFGAKLWTAVAAFPALEIVLGEGVVTYSEELQVWFGGIYDLFESMSLNARCSVLPESPVIVAGDDEDILQQLTHRDHVKHMRTFEKQGCANGKYDELATLLPPHASFESAITHLFSRDHANIDSFSIKTLLVFVAAYALGESVFPSVCPSVRPSL